MYVNVQNSADKRPRMDSQCDQPMMPETSQMSSNQLDLEHNCVNPGERSTLSELQNSVQSESDKPFQSPMIKSQSPALSVSITIVETAILFFY